MFKLEKVAHQLHFHIQRNLFVMDDHENQNNIEAFLSIENVLSNVSYNKLMAGDCH